MTIRQIVEAAVDPNTINTQIKQMITSLNALQQGTQNLQDPSASQKMNVQMDGIEKMASGMKASFQELVKQNLAKQQNINNANVKPTAGVPKSTPTNTTPTANGTTGSTPAANY